MREILFRGKRADDGQWLEGMLTKETIERPSATEVRYKIQEFCIGFLDEWTFEPTYTSGFCDEVIPKTIGQYTGLTDRNGKKIFEGDIVNIIFDDGASQKACAVVFHNGGFCVELWELNISLQKTHSYEFEWLGNIYDNPELLEGNK